MNDSALLAPVGRLFKSGLLASTTRSISDRAEVATHASSGVVRGVDTAAHESGGGRSPGQSFGLREPVAYSVRDQRDSDDRGGDAGHVARAQRVAE